MSLSKTNDMNGSPLPTCLYGTCSMLIDVKFVPKHTCIEVVSLYDTYLRNSLESSVNFHFFL